MAHIIIKRTQRMEAVTYQRQYVYRTDANRGYSFDCDAAGKVDVGALTAGVRESLRQCESGELDVIDRGVRAYTNRWTNPAIGRCYCRREVVLDGFTNTCDCGRDYDQGGILLAPREQWGEETGESLSEIMGIR